MFSLKYLYKKIVHDLQYNNYNILYNVHEDESRLNSMKERN